MPKKNRAERSNRTEGSPATAAAESSAQDELTPVAAGEAVLHHGLTVIEASDPADLSALLADSRLASLVLARIGPTAAVVLPQAAPRLLLALAKAGHTPNVIGEP